MADFKRKYNNKPLYILAAILVVIWVGISLTFGMPRPMHLLFGIILLAFVLARFNRWESNDIDDDYTPHV